MVVDAGDHLGLGAVGQHHAADDVHLPQLHRPAALPAPVILAAAATRHRLDQPVPHEDPVDGAQRGYRAGAAAAAQLVVQPALPPPGMATAQFADRRLHLRADLRRMPVRAMRAVGQPVKALVGIPAQPPVHRLPGHPEPLGNLGHRQTGPDLQHGAIPLLHHAQLNQHSAECHGSSEATS